jgi:cyclase
MLNTRVIPVLLLKGRGLVKTIQFKNPTYVGDPINAVKIFNDKEVDELIFLDVTASGGAQEPNYDLVADIASECFMPFCYGGGIYTIDQAKRILGNGAEKISFNTALFTNPAMVEKCANQIGSQSIVASIDVAQGLFGKRSVYINGGKTNTKIDPVSFAKRCQNMGVGEILANSISRDGTQRGYDLELIKRISESVSVPVIACGGAGSVADLKDAIVHGSASAVAAGSMFVFYGKHRAVLISYPSPTELEELSTLSS